jgi:hypothetical protein
MDANTAPLTMAAGTSHKAPTMSPNGVRSLPRAVSHLPLLGGFDAEYSTGGLLLP